MNTLVSSDAPQDPVEGVLRSFFAEEMPDPWPRATVPLRVAAPRATWLRSFGRMAVAAMVLFMLFGYLTLASLFPAPSEPSEGGLNLRQFPIIGSKPGLKHRAPATSGNEARPVRAFDNARK